MQKATKIVIHILFWGLIGTSTYFAFGQRVIMLRSGGELNFSTIHLTYMLIVIVIDLGLKAFFTYTNIEILQKAVTKSSLSKRYFTKFTLLGLGSYLASGFLAFLVMSYFDQDPLLHTSWFWFSAAFHVFIGLASIGYKLAKDKREEESLEKEKTAAVLRSELEFLKAQINPHFLFNTLNNVYASARKNQDQRTADSIAKLSGIMRYMIDDSNSDKVSLEQEVNYIEDFIALQKLRIDADDPVEISFTKEGDLTRSAVAPLLLIPFVENAFKHGISLDAKSTIDIKLSASDKKINFSVLNTIHRRIDSGTKLGLENFKRRLALIYPEKHSVSISEKDSIFKAELELSVV